MQSKLDTTWTKCSNNSSHSKKEEEEERRWEGKEEERIEEEPDSLFCNLVVARPERNKEKKEPATLLFPAVGKMSWIRKSPKGFEKKANKDFLSET